MFKKIFKLKWKHYLYLCFVYHTYRTIAYKADYRFYGISLVFKMTGHSASSKDITIYTFFFKYKQIHSKAYAYWYMLPNSSLQVNKAGHHQINSHILPIISATMLSGEYILL